MTDNVVKWMLIGVVVSAVLTVFSATAVASHYRLEYLGFLDEAQVEAFDSAGLVTTEDFLLHTLTQADRRQLSEEVGATELEILILARLCELLQVEGVGPRVAQLLRAAGVVSVADLATRDPAELSERLVAVNAVEQLTGVDPNVENLVGWIDAAGHVPYHIE